QDGDPCARRLEAPWHGCAGCSDGVPRARGPYAEQQGIRSRIDEFAEQRRRPYARNEFVALERRNAFVGSPREETRYTAGSRLGSLDGSADGNRRPIRAQEAV